MEQTMTHSQPMERIIKWNRRNPFSPTKPYWKNVTFNYDLTNEAPCLIGLLSLLLLVGNSKEHQH